MPELPDITIYLEALAPRIVGQPLARARITSPSLLRTVNPPLSAAEGRKVVGLRRIGKRIVWEMGGKIFLVFHLMIAGRFKWRPAGTKAPAKVGLASFDFPTGTLLLTEASPKHRASLHVVDGEAGLAAHDPGGLDVFAADLDAFRTRLQSESHTLKRALTDPHLFDGIGNAYSDEILHAAKLSPFQLSTKLSDEEVARLYEATQRTLRDWIERLREEAGGDFPEKVTAFRKAMAVHGRYKEPCPVCGSPVQRIRYADNEANYCATCQTGGRVLADRSLSRLLKADWPRSLDEWEAKVGGSRDQ
ncbi:MAG TPA: DNA-formamidopyrimidine glycosylase family protein [Gemmatimonadales bacterium]|jgi:formamidopyrimidine-DNA glycosylase|nr:DNA-formamidopyrimidine glycosylase family protein [Gemmatimonadales bacterium]